MCFGFGDMKKTESKTENTSIPDWLTGATKENIGTLESLRGNGFQSYTAPRVADLSGDENSAFSLIRSLASGGNPYSDAIKSIFSNVGTAPAAQVSTSRLIDNVPGAPGTASGSTADYMNPYTDAVLSPQLRDIDLQANQRQKDADRRATMGGAFGDARHGFADAEIEKNRGQQRNDVVGKGHADAFDRAMALKGIDLSRLLDVGKTNASLGEQGLLRQMQGGSALMGLDRYDTGRRADLANLLAQAGASGRGVEQAKLDAPYADFLRQQDWPLQLSKMLTSAIGSAPHDTNKNTVTEKPDNTGWGLVGKAAGAGLAFL